MLSMDLISVVADGVACIYHSNGNDKQEKRNESIHCLASSFHEIGSCVQHTKQPLDFRDICNMADRHSMIFAFFWHI